MSELPTVNEVRKRIENIPRKGYRFCLEFAFLAAARISEVVGHSCRRDTSTAIGPTGEEMYRIMYDYNGTEVDTVVFTLRTAKRGKLERKIALPIDQVYEPWTKELYDYFKKRGEHKAFPFNRQEAWRQAKESFKGLRYPIETYKVYENGEITKTVDKHNRKFATHALRHVRATELVEMYGFDGFDLSVYGGWTLRSAVGVSQSVGRYVQLQWRKYYPKLLRKRFS